MDTRRNGDLGGSGGGTASMAGGTGFAAYVMDRPEEGVFTVDRAIFRDPAIFEHEMEYIFERNWVYLAHESQLARPHDFLTASIGRQPVILMRDEDGRVGCFINACPHRGAAVCQSKCGNQKILTCPYHGWSFNSAGKLNGVKGHKQGAYPESFERLNHDLQPIPRLAGYRGFLFGSLSPAVPEVEAWLGGARVFIDMIADQAPHGLEVLKGGSEYLYAGNWKLQAENGVDGYHFDIVHRSFMGVAGRRSASGKDAVKALDAAHLRHTRNGCYDLGGGHCMIWADYPNPEDRPVYQERERLTARFGAVRAGWIFGRVRNLLLYPNVFLMDQTSTQIRVIHPVSVERTRVATYCIAPVGEAAAARAHRLRQYEDFFNASGVGTPDDLAAFEACQRGYRGRLARWQQGYARGQRRMSPGADADAQALGLAPVSSSPSFDDETLFHGQYRQWLSLMNQGRRAERES